MPIDTPNECFDGINFKILMVSLNGKIWEITIDNDGNLVSTDTGETV